MVVDLLAASWLAPEYEAVTDITSQCDEIRIRRLGAVLIL
jgi:hypothetical protein